MAKTFSIKTLGCKLNQYESSQIAGQFLDNGWTSKPFGEKVDVVIVNTCTVTNRSDKKCRNYIRQGAAASNSGKVIVTGCLAEIEEGNLNNTPEVMAAVRNSEKDNIISIADNYYNNYLYNTKEESFSGESQKNKTEFPLPFYRTRGLIKIQDGCDGKCSYCIVPIVRGKPVSRSFIEILEHAHALIDAGCPELILTGITIGKFFSDSKDLSELIKKITDINGNFRVRITSIEPNHISDSLIEHLGNGKVCRHIHIPLQSGSDRILKLMRRPYSIRDYIKTVEKIKRVYDNIAIGTDLIVGFPGETEDDFASSMKVVEQAAFAYVHQFTYSSRSGTTAAGMHECRSFEITERSQRLREFAAGISLNYRKKFLGENLQSIIEKNKGKRGYNAVSDNYIKMLIKDMPEDINQKTGKILDVRLLKAETDINTGEII
jgi:threonylcarbamoyladenosine tRNA methylthiotransferase MtaB